MFDSVMKKQGAGGGTTPPLRVVSIAGLGRGDDEAVGRFCDYFVCLFPSTVCNE